MDVVRFIIDCVHRNCVMCATGEVSRESWGCGTLTRRRDSVNTHTHSTCRLYAVPPLLEFFVRKFIIVD